MIYLDNAATTKINPKVQAARNKAEDETFANSVSLHSFALASNKLIKESKEIIAGAINAAPSEIYFTKGATESNNIAIKSFAGNDSVALTTKIEHSSVYEAFRNFPYKEVRYALNNEFGFIDEDDLKNKITEEVSFVSLIYVNNEIGTIQDIKKITGLIREINKKAIIHIDATQALGKIPCDVKELGVDMMSFSAHKLHGPKGIGALYVKKEIIDKIKPIMYGGGQQIISSGTDNHPAIYAFGIAVKEYLEESSTSYISEINAYMRDKIASNITDYHINSSEINSSPYILSVGFANIKSEVLLHMLEQNEIYVSSGSACSKGDNNRILEALGLDKKYRDGVIRFSFSSEISKADIDYTVEVLKTSIEMIRKVMG